MKIFPLLHRSIIISLVTGGFLTFTQTACSAVTVLFQPAGNDVKVSWSGSLELPDVETLSNTGPATELGSTQHFSILGTLRSGTYGGSTVTSLVFSSGLRDPQTIGSWGFADGGLLAYSDDIVGEMGVNGPTRFDYDPNEQFFFVADKTLNEMGADSFNETLAWTADITGDTITYTTGSPIPEPSSSFLFVLGLIGLTAQRRRANDNVCK